MARLRHAALVSVHAVAGAAIAVALAASVHADVGPFDATLAARPSFTGETVVHLAPLGTITLDTHDAPVAVHARLEELRITEAEAIARRPQIIDTLAATVGDDARKGLQALAIRAVLAAVLGAAIGGVVAARTWKAGLAGAGGGLLVVGVIAGLAASSWRPESVTEPRYSGILTVAPRAVGDVTSVVERFGEYRAQLAELVGNAVTVYRAAESLPSTEGSGDEVRVLHVSDIHLNPQAFDVAGELIRRFDIDAVVDSGDLTDWGTPAESNVVGRIGQLDVPYVYVRGNHDSGSTQLAVAAQPDTVVLDGTHADVAGLRFFGLGDPRYTPDKGEDTGGRRTVADTAGRLRGLLQRARGIDVLVVHDPLLAARAGDQVPLVLAGHRHEVDLSTMEAGATLLVQGSTGGAGLRGLQGEEPEPITASILYFDARADRLMAIDQVTIRGVGDPGVRIQRRVIEQPDHAEATAPDR